MRRPWVPRARWGESSNEMPGDQADGTEGWYLQIGWLGWMVEVEFGSVARSETWLENYRRKQARKAAK